MDTQSLRRALPKAPSLIGNLMSFMLINMICDFGDVANFGIAINHFVDTGTGVTSQCA